MDTSSLFQKLANVLFYLIFLSAVIYTITGPPPDSAIDMENQTYITPAYWINYVWVVIHILLGGFVIYQWFEPANEIVTEGVGWYFILSVLFSIGWLVSLKSGQYIIVFIFILLTTSSVSYIFYKLHRSYHASSWCDKVFLLGPFSLWHGWVVFFAVINLFQAFTRISKDGPNMIQCILVIIGLVFLTFNAIGFVEYKKHKGDITGAAVISLGLLAIFCNQQDPWIHWISLACGIITFLYATRPFVFSLVNAEENVPLLS